MIESGLSSRLMGLLLQEQKLAASVSSSGKPGHPSAHSQQYRKPDTKPSSQQINNSSLQQLSASQQLSSQQLSSQQMSTSLPPQHPAAFTAGHPGSQQLAAGQQQLSGSSRHPQQLPQQQQLHQQQLLQRSQDRRSTGRERGGG